MRVMVVDFSFYAYAVSLANALSEYCHITLMLPDKVDELYTTKVAQQVKLRQFHMSRLRYPSNIFMVNSIFKTINQLKPDVVHQLSWNLWFDLALPLFPDVPLVSTIHDASRHPGDRASISPFHSQQWRRANQVIVHAESIKQQMLGLEPNLNSKLHVIPIGSYDFYTALSSANGSEVEANTTKPPTILFFGRIWEYKGLRYLIEAEPLITSQVPDARIVIAGCGEPFEKYERMMINRDHFIVHNRFIPDEMIAPLFLQASVVVLPYIEASQSAIVNTAYAFGRPVVATPVGGIPEIVTHGETGYLVPPRDPRSLAEAIVTLLKDEPTRLAMGRKALEKSRTELSWPGIARKTIQVYERAVGGNKSER